MIMKNKYIILVFRVYTKNTYIYSENWDESMLLIFFLSSDQYQFNKEFLILSIVDHQRY